jgi:hypothetical protein
MTHVRNPQALTLAFWECGHVEVDQGKTHECDGRDVCSATYRQVLVVEQQHGDVHRCADCALPTSAAIGSYWLASDELWERVVGDEPIVLCPLCFEARAQALGIAVSWRAEAEA